MSSCPHCGHVLEPFGVCVACGRVAAPRPAPGVAAPAPVPELEPTRYAAATVGPILPVEGFEPHTAAAGEVGVERLADLEPNGIGALENGPVTPMPDLEPLGRASAEPQTPLPPVPLCRYCGHVQAAGLLCDVCGMRLPRESAHARAAGETSRPRCPACGVPAGEDGRCRECGSSCFAAVE